MSDDAADPHTLALLVEAENDLAHANRDRYRLTRERDKAEAELAALREENARLRSDLAHAEGVMEGTAEGMARQLRGWAAIVEHCPQHCAGEMRKVAENFDRQAKAFRASDPGETPAHE